MPTKRHFRERLRSRFRSQSPSSSPHSVQPAALSHSQASQASQASPASVLTSRDLWKEAFQKSDRTAQDWMNEKGYGTKNSLAFEAQIQELLELARIKESACSKTPWKIVLGRQTIILREYVADIVQFLSTIGDIAITFAPPQASAPWSALRAIMQIPVMEVEQICALLGTVEKIVRIIRRGQVYELLYNSQTTHGDAIENLQDSLVDLYVASIELLALSESIFSKGAARQTLHAIIHPKHAEGLVANLFTLENRVAFEAQSCENSRSAKADIQLDKRLLVLQAALSNLDTPLARVDIGVQKLLKKVEEAERYALRDWISPELFGQRHNTIRDLRTPGTGEWMLNHGDFREWQSISSASALLLLEGTAGTGKTFLTSRAIDHVQKCLDESQHSEGFAYFFCSRIGVSGVDPLIVLRSYVRQLSSVANASEDVQIRLIKRCAECKEEGTKLGYEDCKGLILESINLYSKTTLVLDALDESDHSSHSLAEAFVDIMNKSTKPVKIFVSCRSGYDITAPFDSIPAIIIGTKNNSTDIEKFLDKELYSGTWFHNRSEQIRLNIRETFNSRTEGMFRWVYLQIRTLLTCVTDEAVDKRLHGLPKDLTGAYDELYADIKTRDSSDVSLAERALKWVMCSSRALEDEELLEAIRWPSKGETVVPTRRPTRQELLTLCRDLLTVDRRRNVWELSHLSVADYFESQHWSMKEAHLLVAKVSLNLLNKTFSDIDPNLISAKLLSKKSINGGYVSENIALPGVQNLNFLNGTFQRYIQYFWPAHVRHYEKELRPGDEASIELSRLLKDFLGSPEKSSLQYRRWHYFLTKRKRHCPENSGLNSRDLHDLRPSTISLFAMCRFAFYHTLLDWWKGECIDKIISSALTSSGLNALALAAMAGSTSICELLTHKIDIDTPLDHCICGSALIAAIHKKKARTAKFLISEANAKVNMQAGGHYGSALVAAALQMDSIELTGWLVEKAGADVNLRLRFGLFGSALAAASYRRNLVIIKYLVLKGANVNEILCTGPYGSALAAAVSCRENIETVNFLIESGADVNLLLQSGDYGSALAAAVCRPFPKVSNVERLLDAGAKATPVLPAGYYGSAIAAAAFWGHQNILQRFREGLTRHEVLETLCRSRCPPTDSNDHKKALRYRFRHVQEGRKETARYLVEQFGLDETALERIGLESPPP